MTDYSKIPEYTEQQLDNIVEQIKSPVMALDEIYAELCLAHAYFEAITTIGLFQGLSTKEQFEKRITDSFGAFLEGNPLALVRSSH